MIARCISCAFSEFFCEELGFVEAVSYLKRLYFSESADWMASLAKNLFHEVSKGDTLSARMLSSLFDTCLLESAYRDLPPSSHVTVSLTLTESTGGEDFYDASSLQLINKLTLRASVQWPLSLVITDIQLEHYNAVFRALMRIRQARWWIDQIWNKFNEVKRFDQLDRVIAGRLKQLRLWYQVVTSHSITVVSSDMCQGCHQHRLDAAEPHAS